MLMSVNRGNITTKTITGTLSGRTGPTSADGCPLKDILLYHGKPLQVMCEEFAEWVKFLCNTMVHWAWIRVLIKNRVCVIDKHTGVRPLEIRCIIRHLLVKCVLKDDCVGAEATFRIK